MDTVRTMGACLTGAGAELVGVEARFDTRERERVEVVLTGLPDSVLKESRSRLECALSACGLHLPQGRLWLNLVPASRRKSGESLDLPLAVAAAAATGHIDPAALRSTLFLGEVGIDGVLHGVPGGLAAAMAAKARGVARLVAPPATAREAAAVAGVAAHPARSLAAVIAHLTGTRSLPALPVGECEPATRAAGPSLDEVRGLEDAKWALAVAAAGGHGLLFVGPPGAGKSLLARRLVRLLPPPSLEERMELTRVLSANGRWPGGLSKERPFRAPHHSTSCAGLVGGGPSASAGEVTLAHGGVLFLDELPEFRRDALEALRQPLESGSVLLARAKGRVELPAQFQLVAAMNPCPCGWRGHRRVPCRCSAHAVARYRAKISGPLLDRIDLCVEVQPPEFDELLPASVATGADMAWSNESHAARAASTRLDMTCDSEVHAPLGAHAVCEDAGPADPCVPHMAGSSASEAGKDAIGIGARATHAGALHAASLREPASAGGTRHATANAANADWIARSGVALPDAARSGAATTHDMAGTAPLTPGSGSQAAGVAQSRCLEARLSARVDAARAMAVVRQGPTPNARLAPGELDRCAPLCEASRELLRRAAKSRALSARAIQSLRRVARTLADLEGRERIAPADLAAALGLRGALA